MFLRLTAKKKFQLLRRRCWKIWGIQRERHPRTYWGSNDDFCSLASSHIWQIHHLWICGLVEAVRGFCVDAAGDFFLIECVILWNLEAYASSRDPLPQVKPLNIRCQLLCRFDWVNVSVSYLSCPSCYYSLHRAWAGCIFNSKSAQAAPYRYFVRISWQVWWLGHRLKYPMQTLNFLPGKRSTPCRQILMIASVLL